MRIKNIKILDLFDASERRQALLLFVKMIFMGLLEVVSVSLILPFMDILSNPKSIETKWYLRAIKDQFQFEEINNFGSSGK